MPDFVIDPRLAGGSTPLISLKLSEARVQADARWPWIVLIPRKSGARELEHLTAADRSVLMDEVVAAGSAVRAMAAAAGRPIEKLNVGALGNKVEQLHLHIVGRRADDPAWPEPVWGLGKAVPYGDEALAAAREAALTALQGLKRK